MFDLDTNILLRIFGGFFILAGLLGMLGRWKGWYWHSQNSIYGYPPIGLLFIVTSFEQPLRTWMPFGNAGLIGLYSIILVLGMWGFVKPPRFFKPHWIQVIEEQPKAVYRLMAEQARKNKEWRKWAANDVALADWIKSVRKQVKKK